MSIESAAEALVAKLEKAGCDEVQQELGELADQLAAPISSDAERALKKAIGALRARRCFAQMVQLCDRIANHAEGSLLAHAWRQWAQAKIERGDFDAAKNRLDEALAEAERIDDRKEQSEALGLMGRTAKQRFVRATQEGDQQAAKQHLRDSVEFYGRAFPLDPSWHGANLVALRARAERDGVAVNGPSAKEWADRLLDALASKGEDEWGPWDNAGAAEAYLAKEDTAKVAKYFARYWQAPNVSQFALAGTERQLKEIWQIKGDSGDSFLDSLLVHIEARKIDKADGSVTLTPKQLCELATRIRAEAAHPEALFRGCTVPLDRVLKLLQQAQRVCCIRDRRDPGKAGTGFLVAGSELSPGLAGSAFVVTNHHVLHGDEATDALLESEDYDGSIHVKNADAVFHYWNGAGGTRTFKLEKVVQHSPRPGLDFAIASFEGEQPPECVTLCTSERPLQSRNFKRKDRRSKVFVVGHPGGNDLSFSLSDNEVIDHELDGDSVGTRPRRIHYKAPTEPGSSGSPVFEHLSVEVIGVHRSGSAAPLRDPWPGKKSGEPYEANEAVSIRSIREFLASQAPGKRDG